MPNVNANGTRMAYVEHGQGQPVVFVHGGSADLRIWENHLPVFGTAYRAIAVSCRGYCPNPAPQADERPTLDTYVADLIGFVRALALPPVHLVGHSSPGGFASLLLAQRQPALLRSLVLIEPPAFPLLGVTLPPRPPQLAKLMLRQPGVALGFLRFGIMGIGPATKAFARGDDEAGLRRFMHANLGRAAFATMPPSRFQQALENIAPLKAQITAGFPPFSEQEARSIRVPTLLVSGGASNAVLRGVTARLAQLLPDVERLTIAHASHNMFESDPEPFDQGVMAFLAQHRA